MAYLLTLWQISIINTMAAAQSPCRSFKTRVLHSRLKNTPLKDKKMERKSSKECSAFFLWWKGSFSSRNRPSRNSTLFSSKRRISSLFCMGNATKAVKFLLNFQVHFALYGQDNYVFEREFMYFWMFHRRFINFSFSLNFSQNVPWFEMDFVLNFAMCLADFTCVNGSTIQIVFSELL